MTVLSQKVRGNISGVNYAIGGVPKPFLVSKILALYVEYNSPRGKGVCNLSKEHEGYFNIC